MNFIKKMHVAIKILINVLLTTCLWY